MTSGMPVGGAPPAVAAEGEAAMLARAVAALGANPIEALAITNEHVARFPGGSLAQERERIAIEALMRVGRVEAGRARAARFLAAFPRSVHRARVEAIAAP